MAPLPLTSRLRASRLRALLTDGRLPAPLHAQLMKRLRGAKAATVGTKEEKKKVMGALDSDIHKLLGAEYKRYRTVQHAQHEMHTSLKKSTSSSSSTAAATPAATAPPPPVATAAPKKKGLPGAKSKKKASSTTVTG